MCSIPIQHSLCDDLVCLLFANPTNMYTAGPVSTAGSLMTAMPTQTSLDLGGLEEATEQFCCLEELLRDVGTKPFNESLEVSWGFLPDQNIFSSSPEFASWSFSLSTGPLVYQQRH